MVHRIDQMIGVITATSPATESVAVTSSITGLSRYNGIRMVAELQGATGGTLDVVVQHKVGDTWYDYGHFAQLAAAASAVIYDVDLTRSSANAINTIGSGTSNALAAGVWCGGWPADEVRLLFDAGASTSAGASQVLKVWGHRRG